MTDDQRRNMVFQIITNDKRLLTVHTEVGDGLTKVVIDEEERDEGEQKGDDDCSSD